jgi:hypothetical protein
LCRNRDGIVTFEIRRLAMHIRRALATFAPRSVGRKGCGVPASKSSDAIVLLMRSALRPDGAADSS